MLYSKEKLADLRKQEATLREQMGKLAVQMHERASTDEWTQEKTNAQLAAGADHNRIKNELDLVHSDIAQMEKHEPQSKKQSESLFNKWIRGGADAIGSDAKQFCDYDANKAPSIIPRSENGSIFALPTDPDDYLAVTGRQMMAPANTTAGDAASGQHVVPRSDDPTIVEEMLYIGGFSAACYNFTSPTGGEHRMRSIDDTAQEGAYLNAQNTDAAKLKMPNFNNVNFGSHTLTSGMYYETNEWIADASADAARILERA